MQISIAIAIVIYPRALLAVKHTAYIGVLLEIYIGSFTQFFEFTLMNKKVFWPKRFRNKFFFVSCALVILTILFIRLYGYAFNFRKMRLRLVR